MVAPAAAGAHGGCRRVREAEPPAVAGRPRRRPRRLCAALDAWQKGDAADALKERRPPVYVVDTDWRSGRRLLGYQLLGDDPRGSDLRCGVVLSLDDGRGRPVKQAAVYGVGTSPVLTVVARGRSVKTSPLSPVHRGEGPGVRGNDFGNATLTPNPSPRSTGERGDRTSSFSVQGVFTMLLTTTALLLSLAAADEPSPQPKPVPVTRPDMKQALEDLKKRQPRLQLPPLTDEEKAKYGDRPPVNNGRMRQLYLSADLRGGDFSRPRPGPDARFGLQDAAVLDRVAGQQLRILPRPPGAEAGGGRHDRRPAGGPGRGLGRLPGRRAGGVRVHAPADLRAAHHRRGGR